MVTASLDAFGHRCRHWGRGRLWRLDFDKITNAVQGGGLEALGSGGGLPHGPKVRWILPRDQRRVVFLSGVAVAVGLDNQDVSVEAVSTDVFLDAEGEDGAGRVYTSANFDGVAPLAREGKVSLLHGLHIFRGNAFQRFIDKAMTDADWSRLGFTPPRENRAALDSCVWGKHEDGRYLCLPHTVLEDAAAACPSLWSNFVDSCHAGAYFSKMVVERAVHTGPAAGWPTGCVILPHPEFIEGAPYRRADSRLQTSRTGSARLASAVWHKGAQYLSFDPMAVAGGTEISARWATRGGWESGVFSDPGKYGSAREIRRTHYVPPRTRTVRVWANGAPCPEPHPCILSPEGGGRYSKRPDKDERKRLVSKYGKEAVPRNFSKFTEGQISRKSELLKKTKEGRWVYVPPGGDGDGTVARGYSAMGETPSITWAVLRQIALPGDIESDPIDGGLYARLPTRDEMFEGDRLRRLLRIMERDGFDFLVREIVSNPDGLRKNLLTVAVS